MKRKQTRSNKPSLLPKKIVCVNNNYFGEALKELRIKRNLKQYEAAERLGITPAQWSIYESGKSRPTLDMIILISEVLSTSPFVLLGRSLDKSKYSNTGLELSLEDYENITQNSIESLRKKKKEAAIKSLNELI